MKKMNLIIAILFVVSLSLTAQSKETKEKLKNIKGNVTKITIETDDGNIEIAGEEAKALLKNMLGKKRIIVKTIDGDDFNGNADLFFFKEGEDDGEMKIKVDVDIEDEDGEKSVIIKKIIDGKVTVKKYSGDDAEAFIIKNSKSGNGYSFISDDDSIKVFVKLDSDNLSWTTEDGEFGVSENINVEVKDGVKTVTVTNTKDGEKTVTVYEGEEADEFLEKMDKSKNMHFSFSEDSDSGTVKQKIIIIKEVEEED